MMAWTVLKESGRYQGLYRDGSGETRSAGTFDHKPRAYKAALNKEDEQRQPGALDPALQRATWGAWWDEWFETRLLAESTEMQYRSTHDLYLREQWGQTKLGDIKHLAVQKWITGLHRQGKSPWILRNVLMLFNTSLNAAVAAGRLVANPAKKVVTPPLPEGLERYLTPEEVDRITFFLDGPNALLVLVGVNTGMRFGEIAGLHWPRLDLDAGTARIIEKFNQKTGNIDPLPKDKEQRTVPLPAELVAQLRHYRETTAEHRRETCGRHHKAGRCVGDLVFRGARGAPFKSNDWGKTVWAKALVGAGIEGRVRPHDMRHTYASWLLQQGISIPELARMMGHSRWEVTQRYAHFANDGHDEIRGALDRQRLVGRLAAPLAEDEIDTANDVAI